MTSHWPRGRTARPAAVVLAVATLATVVMTVALVVVLSGDERPRAEAGQVLESEFALDPLPHRAEVRLPWMAVRVAAGEVRAELPDLLGAEANVGPPEGGSFVRVGVGLPQDHDLLYAATADGGEPEVEVVLVADGREYPIERSAAALAELGSLFSLSEVEADYWVAVDGDPTELAVEMTVDGVTQVVDAADGSVDTGAAAALDAVPTQRQVDRADTTDCGPVERLDDTGLRFTYAGAGCEVDPAVAVPYVGGLGWAPKGEEYLVVRTASALPATATVGPIDGSFDVVDLESPAEPVVRLGGEPPDARIGNVDGFGTVQSVFLVAADEPVGDLVVTQRAEIGFSSDAVPGGTAVVARWVVQGEELR